MGLARENGVPGRCKEGQPTVMAGGLEKVGEDKRLTKRLDTESEKVDKRWTAMPGTYLP